MMIMIYIYYRCFVCFIILLLLFQLSRPTQTIVILNVFPFSFNIARWIALIFLNILWIFKKFIRLCHVKLSTILLLFTICLKINLK